MSGSRLDGQVALVLGGAENIGAAVTRTLATLGARLFVVDVKAGPLDTLVSELGREGVEIHGTVGDCTLRETAEAAVAQALEQFGRIDCAVQLVGGGNRAGVNFWSETDEDWDRILRTSLKTHMYLLRAVVEPMKQRGSGSIVLLSADSGRNGGGVVNLVAYSAAKAAVIALAKSAARDLGGHGIRVNCVSPGPTDTVKPGAVSGAVEAATAAIVASTPMGRRAQPEEVAAAVAWFCSPASRFVTGQTLSVNGGMLMPG